jgi:hypothetical protein
LDRSSRRIDIGTSYLELDLGRRLFMTRLVWDQVTERDYETGLDRGVFYPLNGPGHVWNGLQSVEESPSEADFRPRYLDGKKIGNRGRKGEFSATVKAFTYPTTFSSGLVTPQRRSHFGLSYRIKTDNGYKIHLVYNALATPSNGNYVFNDETSFSWSLTTRGITMPDGTNVSHLVIDTNEGYSWTIEALENALYGTEEAAPRLPTPAEVLEIFEENSILRIIDHGDGTWTAIGPDDVISMLDPTTFQIDYSTAVYISEDAYTIHSL